MRSMVQCYVDVPDGTNSDGMDSNRQYSACMDEKCLIKSFDMDAAGNAMPVWTKYL